MTNPFENKKTYEGFGLIITLKDWVDYCNLRQNTSSNKDKEKQLYLLL